MTEDPAQHPNQESIVIQNGYSADECIPFFFSLATSASYSSSVQLARDPESRRIPQTKMSSKLTPNNMESIQYLLYAVQLTLDPRIMKPALSACAEKGPGCM